jgi:hypothetical protein
MLFSDDYIKLSTQLSCSEFVLKSILQNIDESGNF